MDHVRDQIRRFCHGHEYRGSGRRVPLKQFARLCGVSRQTLYDILHYERKGLTKDTRDRILHAIKLVDSGVRWKRQVVRKAVVERIVHSPAIIEWRPVMPDGSPAPLLRKQQSPAEQRRNLLNKQRWLSEPTPA